MSGDEERAVAWECVGDIRNASDERLRTMRLAAMAMPIGVALNIMQMVISEQMRREGVTGGSDAGSSR